MGIKVHAFMGAEVLPKRLNLNAYYLQVEKIKRGYYEATFIPITEDAKNREDYSIVKKHLSLLEKQIHRKLEYYLWSHRRWKHRNAPIPKGTFVD